MPTALPKEPQNVNKLHKQSLTFQDRLALVITNAIGTMYAVYAFAGIMVIWILWQTFLSGKPFDPYPFAFLLFLGNIVQLLLMPLIMVGQNLQGRKSEIKEDEEFRTTKASFADLTEVIQRLDRIEAELKKVHSN